jgi:hypothetical protein
MSSSWQLRCSRCRATSPSQPGGLLRSGAASWLKVTIGWCAHCGGLRLFFIERPDASEREDSPPRSALS